MPLIAAELLGPPLLTIDGQPPPRELRWRKHLALCLLLWHAEGRRLSRDRLIALLWGDRREREARHSLNEALRIVRRAAGSDAISSEQDRIGWTGQLRLDTDRFAAVERSDPPLAAALIRGDWCEGFTVPDASDCDRWLDDERRIWRTRLVTALVGAAGVAEGRGDLVTALDLADRARRIEPLSETAMRAAARALFLGGHRSGALALAREVVEQMESELGATAEAETLELLRVLATGEHRGRPATTPAAAPIAPLLGRQAIMARLSGTLDRAVHTPRSALIVIQGEPGSGRTRILEEVERRAAVDGATTVLVRAVPADTERPGGALRVIAGAMLGAAPGVAAVPPLALATLVAEVPAWAEKFPLPAVGGGTPSLVDAVVAALRATAVDRPFVLLLDDIDWLDEATLLALPELLRAAAELPVVIAATTDTSCNRLVVEQLRRHVDREARGVLVSLDAFDVEALMVATSAVMPTWTPEARDRLARRLHVESAGLPAVAFPVLEAVLEGMEFDGEAWPQADRTYDATLPGRLAGPLVAAVRLRFQLVDVRGRRLLALLALADPPVPPELLVAVTTIPEEELLDTLDRLEADHWLVSDRRGYQFRARAVGSLVATELVTPGQRRRLLDEWARVTPR